MRDVTLCNTKLRSEHNLCGSSGVQPSNLKHFCGIQFCLPLDFAILQVNRRLRSTFPMPIMAIFRSCSERKMIRIKTWRVIAGMHDIFVSRDSPVNNFVCKPVDPPILSAVANHAITAAVLAYLKRPYKARIRILVRGNHRNYQRSLARMSLVHIEALVLWRYKHRPSIHVGPTRFQAFVPFLGSSN